MDRFNNQVLKEAIHLCAFENGLLNYCFVMSSKTCKDYTEYFIKLLCIKRHITSLEH